MQYQNPLRLLLALLLLSSGAFAQSLPKPAGPQPDVERLRAHVTYLASDKLDGRRTGTEGARAAAEYIAREFGRYGLRRSNGIDRPGMSVLEADSPRRYMQEFLFISGVALGRNNSLLFAPRGLKQDAGSTLSSTRGASL